MTIQTDPAGDVVDLLAAIEPHSPLDELRRRRPETREQIQASFDALFAPVDHSEIGLAERWLIAAFATRIAGESETARFYSARAHEVDAERATAVAAEAAASATTGPYGTYTESGLQGENADGPHYRVGAGADVLGARLSAALEHTHLLVFRPRESSADALQALLDAGWSVDAIVTLSQLVAFLSFQLRVAAGLRVLATVLGGTGSGTDAAADAAAAAEGVAA